MGHLYQFVLTCPAARPVRRQCRFAAPIVIFLAHRPSFLTLLAVSSRPRRGGDHSGRAAGGLWPEQKFPPSHAVRQIHQPDLHRRPHLALCPHKDVALARSLIAEDMLDAGAGFRAPMIHRLLLICSFSSHVLQFFGTR